MKTRAKVLIHIFVLVLLSTNLIAQVEDEETIKETILNGYINGAFNGLDPDGMGETFHEEFAIFSADGEKLNRYPIASWKQNVTNQKNSPNFDAADNVWDHSFEMVDEALKGSKDLQGQPTS